MSRYWVIFTVVLSMTLPLQSLGQWTVLPTGTNNTFYNMTAVDDLNLYGFGSTFVKSTDGGASWTVLTPNTVSSWVNAGFFINPNVGWIGGKYGVVGGEILKT